jgi:hypothetical protein
MTRRSVALLLLIACVAPSPAFAQGAPGGGAGGNPFGPLPQPQAPAPQPPEPQPVDTPSSNDNDALGGTAFWLIVGATGVLFVAVGFFIVRDMRKTVGTRKKRRRTRGTGRPAANAAQALAEQPRHTPGSQKARAKAQQRAKTKAARRQRRKTRSR